MNPRSNFKWLWPALLCATTGHAQQAAPTPAPTQSALPAVAATEGIAAPAVTPASAGEAASELFDWKLQPPVGFKSILKTFARVKMAQTVAAPPRLKMPPIRIEITMLQTILMDYETISRDDRGGTVSRLTYRKIDAVTHTKINGKSAPTGDSASAEKVGNALIGAQIDIKQGPDGHVWSVQGIQALRRRFNRTLAGLDPNVRALMTPIFDAAYSEKMFRQTWDTSATRPAHPVGIGDSWAYQTTDGQLPLGMEMRGTRKLIALDAERATIADDATIVMNHKLVSDTKITPHPLLPSLSIQGSGTSRGQSIVDRETGLQTEVTAALRWTGKYRSAGNTARKVPALDLVQWIQSESRQILTMPPQSTLAR